MTDLGNIYKWSVYEKRLWFKDKITSNLSHVTWYANIYINGCLVWLEFHNLRCIKYKEGSS